MKNCCSENIYFFCVSQEDLYLLHFVNPIFQVWAKRLLIWKSIKAIKTNMSEFVTAKKHNFNQSPTIVCWKELNTKYYQLNMIIWAKRLIVNKVNRSFIMMKFYHVKLKTMLLVFLFLDVICFSFNIFASNLPQ